jgi:hypothetical protein
MATLSESLTAWQLAWRRGIAPSLSDRGLLSLKKALETDDPALIQGASIKPPPLQATQDWPVEAACAICFVGWRGDGLETVADVEEFFARTCFEADQALGEPAGCRYFLNWFDETPREQMRIQLLAEVTLALYERQLEETR